MAEVTTTKAVNLGQLAGEVGASLTMSDSGAQRTVTCLNPATTQTALQAAVDAHVAIDEAGNRATLEQQAVTALGNNRTFLAIANPTNAQVAAQVKALTRQSNGIIRLLLGRLDGTD